MIPITPPVETPEARGPQPDVASVTPVADDGARAAVQDGASTGGRVLGPLPYPLGKVITYHKHGHVYTALCVITHASNGTAVALTPGELWAFARAKDRQVDVDDSWDVASGIIVRVLTRDAKRLSGLWYQALALPPKMTDASELSPT